MSELMQAADAVKAAARPFRAVIQLADALEKIGSVEQAANEAKLRLEKFVAEGDKVALFVETAQAELETLRGTLANLEAKRVTAIEEAKAAASSEAAKIIAEAKVEADKIRSDADECKTRFISEAQEAQGVLSKLNANIDEAKSQHAELTMHIDHLKRKFGA